MKLVAFILMFFGAMTAFASGGKVNNPVIIDSDTECVLDITGIDLEKCTDLQAAPQSGISVFNCDVTVICAADD